MDRTTADVARGDQAEDLRLQSEDVVSVPQSMF